MPVVDSSDVMLSFRPGRWFLYHIQYSLFVENVAYSVPEVDVIWTTILIL